MVYRILRRLCRGSLRFLLRLLRICVPTLDFFDFEVVRIWFRATFFVFSLSLYLTLCSRCVKGPLEGGFLPYRM